MVSYLRIIIIKNFPLLQVPIECKMNIQQTQIPAGSTTELFCTSNSLRPETIPWQWYHNSLSLSTQQNRYLIINATRKHMGMYQCCYIPISPDFNSCCAQTQIRITRRSFRELIKLIFLSLII